MTVSPGIANAWPHESRLWQTALYACAVLLGGFLLVEAPAVVALFGYVAEFLAACAAALLRLAGYDIVRNGTELRDNLTGNAVAVTSACDGNGLLVSAAGAITWLKARSSALRPLALFAVEVTGAILAFNLVRILVLFLSIGAPRVMFLLHLYVAPLLSTVLIAGFALSARMLRPEDLVRSPVLWFAVALAGAAVWYQIDDLVTCAVAVPLSNALLWFIPGDLTRAITCAEPAAMVVTSAALSPHPAAALTAAFHPADFTLATPLIAASLVFRRRTTAIVRGAVISLLLFSLAMTAGAITASHDEAMAAGASMLVTDEFIRPYHPPPLFLLALLKAIQNVLVHFNLFILPLFLAGLMRVPATSTTVAGAAGSRTRQSGQNRRRARR